MADTLPPFGAYLRAAVDRHEELDTLTDLARKSEIDPSVVGRWSRGETTPSLDNARALAGALHRPLLEVLVAASLLTEAEAQLSEIGISLERAENHQLLDEVRRRMRGPGATIRVPTEADLATNPNLRSGKVTGGPPSERIGSVTPSGRRRKA